MSEALQSAQQSLQQAGQQAQNGESNEASEGEMGQEFGQSQSQGQGGQGQQSGQGQGQTKNGGQGKGNKSQNRQSGGGMGGAGIGQGGHAGAQQPLPGQKREVLVPGTVNPHGKQLSRTYYGTPDPTKDKAAYYSLVPEKVKAQEASLNREDIPTAVKKPVQRYFDSIQPQGK
jgi:hypothetical protein